MPRRILIIDDDMDSAESLAMLLEMSGHHTRAAFDGRQALAMAQDFRPEVVLCDLGLPVMNGHEIAAELRKLFPADQMVLAALTGRSLPDDIERSTAAGFSAHFVKPVDADVIERFIESAPASG